MTAAFPICFGGAWKAACIEFRAPGRCMRMSIESNSALKALILDSGALQRAVYSSMEIRTALGASCFVITTTPTLHGLFQQAPKFILCLSGSHQSAIFVSGRHGPSLDSYFSYLSLNS